MAVQFIGDAVVVEFGTVDISGTARTVTVSEQAPAPDQIDSTHKGDTARVMLEGLPGSVATTATLEGLDEIGGVANIFDLTLNAEDTLLVYPRGKTHSYELLTIQNCRYIGIDQNIAYDDVVGFTASFSAQNTVTRGTYSTGP